MSLEKLETAINIYNAKQIQAEKKRRDAKNRQNEEREREKQKENHLLDDKIRMCEEILQWRDKFTKTTAFKKLIDIYESGADIYYDNWGHQTGGYGCCSRILMEKTGRLKYYARYKWFPESTKIGLENVKDFAKALRHEYILALHEHIKSGKVYELLAKNLCQKTV